MPFTLLKSNAIDGGIDRPNSKPLIINGNMAVAQRGTSASSITDTGYRTCDRWEVAIGTLGTWTISQDTDVPTGYGFANSLKLDCTTADASPAASDNISIKQKLEGQNVQVLKKGTANAEKVTIAFWIKATKTGTNILEIHDRDNTRLIGKSYTVDTTNTWEQKVIVIDADTTGALGDDNGNSWEMNWWLGAGTTFTSGTLQTTWGGQTNANRAVGQVNHGDSTSNNVWITGVQMEVGEYTSSTLPPFQHESYADNLARCQRYYQFEDGELGNCGKSYSMTNMDMPCTVQRTHTVEMRVAPTVTLGSSNIRRSDNTSMSANINASEETNWFYGIKKTGGSAEEYGVQVGNITFSSEL